MANVQLGIKYGMTNGQIAMKIMQNEHYLQSVVRFLREIAENPRRKGMPRSEESVIRGARNTLYNLGETKYINSLDQRDRDSEEIRLSRKRKGGRKAP